MPRPDYEKWLGLADEFKAETGFDISSFRNGTYHYPFSKMTNPAIRAQEVLSRAAMRAICGSMCFRWTAFLTMKPSTQGCCATDIFVSS